MTALAQFAGLVLMGAGILIGLVLWNLRHPKSIGVALVAAAREGRAAQRSPLVRAIRSSCAWGLSAGLVAAGFVVLAVVS